MNKKSRKNFIFKSEKLAYYYIKDLRTSYYKAKVNKNKLVKRVRISKDKFYKDIAKLNKFIKR